MNQIINWRYFLCWLTNSFSSWQRHLHTSLTPLDWEYLKLLDHIAWWDIVYTCLTHKAEGSTYKTKNVQLQWWKKIIYMILCHKKEIILLEELEAKAICRQIAYFIFVLRRSKHNTCTFIHDFMNHCGMCKCLDTLLERDFIKVSTVIC